MVPTPRPFVALTTPVPDTTEYIYHRHEKIPRLVVIFIPVCVLLLFAIVVATVFIKKYRNLQRAYNTDQLYEKRDDTSSSEEKSSKVNEYLRQRDLCLQRQGDNRPLLETGEDSRCSKGQKYSPDAQACTLSQETGNKNMESVPLMETPCKDSVVELKG
ncbi:hypothetical protein SK128_012939 [Halocaridina rubra]|uniref:Uncharacterized protein n=1 Tax=Halocaridina rubra TaxID=373956 RepID=A0AAN8ZTZ8_HALRR